MVRTENRYNKQGTFGSVLSALIMLFLLSSLPDAANAQRMEVSTDRTKSRQSDKSYHYHMVKRADFVIGPQLGVVITDEGYAAEVGLMSINSSSDRPFGLSLSYVSNRESIADPVENTTRIYNERLDEVRYREEIEREELSRHGIRGMIKLPVSAAWMITLGGGADYVLRENKMENYLYRSVTGEPTPDSNMRFDVQGSSFIDSDNYWDPVVSVGFETFFGRFFNAGAYAAGKPVEDFYNHIQVGVYTTFNIGAF